MSTSETPYTRLVPRSGHTPACSSQWATLVTGERALCDCQPDAPLPAPTQPEPRTPDETLLAEWDEMRTDLLDAESDRPIMVDLVATVDDMAKRLREMAAENREAVERSADAQRYGDALDRIK